MKQKLGATGEFPETPLRGTRWLDTGTEPPTEKVWNGTDWEALGATGEFPEGKVDDSDEGELRLAIAYDPATNLVRIEFGKPVAWLAMDPEHALRFADAIIKAAMS